MMEKAQELIERIKNIPGEKLITLFSIEGVEKYIPLSFIIDTFGNFENSELYLLCITETNKLINIGGVMTVCDFLSDKKIIYGFILREGTWTSLEAEEMEALYYYLQTTNSDLDSNVGFCNF